MTFDRRIHSSTWAKIPIDQTLFKTKVPLTANILNHVVDQKPIDSTV